MTRDEFNVLMDGLGIFMWNQKWVLKGFVIEWGSDYAAVSGKIPLPLANIISSDLNNKLKICVGNGNEKTLPIESANHSILQDYSDEFLAKAGTSNRIKNDEFEKNYYQKKAQLISEGRENEMYIEHYNVYTIEGVKHILKCIRDYKVEEGFFNEWALGSKTF